MNIRDGWIQPSLEEEMRLLARARYQHAAAAEGIENLEKDCQALAATAPGAEVSLQHLAQAAVFLELAVSHLSLALHDRVTRRSIK
jgi:hypothetical protein